MTDIVERLRRGEHWPQAAADEIERLRAEVETWVGKAKTAIWSDSEECKLLSADNERLRAALLAFAKHFGPLEDNEMLHEEARRCFALARAALEGK